MKNFQFLLIALLAVNSLHAQSGKDTTAIKKLLEKESSTWRAGDVKAHASCWHIEPYSKILISTPDGKTFDIPPSAMIRPQANMFGKGGSSINTNYLMSIHGNDAWVSHDEQSTTKDGAISYSHEIRILEKINNEWKLVAQSVHVYKPE